MDLTASNITAYVSKVIARFVLTLVFGVRTLLVHGFATKRCKL